MKARIISVILVLLMAFCTISCDFKVNSSHQTGNNTNSSQIEGSNSQNLQILKSDFKLSEEDMVSRIKAEYLIENNGYKPNDEIIVMVTLKGSSLMDVYNEEYSFGYSSVAEFANTPVGKSTLKNIEVSQSALVSELNGRGLIEEVTQSYDVLLNAVAVKVKYGNLQAIENLSGVESTIIADTYNLPKTVVGDDVSAIENAVDIYDTGIFKPVGVKYTGKNTSVAVLDSGFDCSHSVFNENIPSSDSIMFSEEEISEKISALNPQTNEYLMNASKLTRGLELGDVYYSRKIPFVYDYADKDPDVFPYDSEHGTHVAGIIGGQDEKITGIAKDTQLVLMKVFKDLDSGASTDDILSALEDAVVLGVDAINMSLGSACGFSREEDKDRLNKVYDAINDAGISLITAASNDYNSAYGGAEGNTNKVTNPDSATVGSPSTYLGALSVASISGTKSRYIIGNDSQVFFFNESNSINGKENNFFEELGIGKGESRTYEYVKVPGYGIKVNYSSIDVKGKIALVSRGDNTFEEKARLAKAAGAIACIIYNNVEGDIIMSMGKSDHIPTISISKEDGTLLSQRKSGTLLLSDDNKAGPFMSDFSSWGPTPDLKIKPEITAHGGNILSAIPGGGYDTQSGTSMASPNMCGAVVLLRQHLKELYPNATPKQISVMANQLLMSTATIVLNEQGNPYSPRKQGAGLASLKGAVSTPAYITVDGIDRTKLELGDDPQRTGKYEMSFNVVNTSDKAVEYNLSTVAMTESVSTSDKDFVAEKSYMLSGNASYEVLNGSAALSGSKITVDGGKTAQVKVTYILSEEDKQYINEAFIYGMFVEGFVKLTATGEDGINLNAPFLAFYGDWTEAPLFDKTYYEVESEAHNGAIDEEDKLKADYFTTTPYGSYYYNYIIPLGTYLYDIDTNKFDAIPATEEHIAMSNALGTIDGLSCVYAGLLRNAKEVDYSIVDKVTGEVVWSYVDYNAQKAHYSGIQYPYYDNLKVSNYNLGLVNNRQYEFTMSAKLDYGDGGAANNARNSFSFDFYMDEEAPVLKEVSYDKEYDKALKKDRYYINMTIYDNHYAMSVTPILFTSSSSYTTLTDNPIPLYGERGEDVTVRFEITDYLEDISFDQIIQSGLAFAIDDYALNSNLYICQLPGTKGEFSFTSNGKVDGTPKVNLTVYEGEVVDLTQYLATSDPTLDENKDYLKYLVWESSNSSVATVSEGLLKCLKAGDTVITVTEQMDLKNATIIIKVKKRGDAYIGKDNVVEDYDDAQVKKIRFSHFETLFAYSRAAQYSEIGSTGDTIFLSSLNGIKMYPGEKIKLFHDFDPWYAEDNYELSYSSSIPETAIVNENGEVTALKEGATIIELKLKGSNLIASVAITVNSEFIIENRQLIAYKGLGGEVKIPDDEGILYIASYAFCLYETDQTMELPEDDFDANKIPAMNTTITKVIIPEGVEDIQKYAFYNCVGLKEVVIPDSIKYIREYAFYNTALESVDVKNARTIGSRCFAGCKNLESITMPSIYAVGIRAFEGCEKLDNLDLTSLRNTGAEAFKDCSSLKNVILGENTKLSYAAFVRTGIESIDIYEKESIPDYCFAQCPNLKRVTFHNGLSSIGLGAFCENPLLEEINFESVEYIGEQAFYKCENLKTLVLPNCSVEIGEYSFLDCSALEKVVFGESTKLNSINGSVFAGTNLSTFEVAPENVEYKNSTDGKLLLNGNGNQIIFAVLTLTGEYVLDESYNVIGASAFAGTKIETLTIISKDTVIGDYAFVSAESLKTVNLPSESGVVIGAHAFEYATALESVNNLDKVTSVGDLAFAHGGAIGLTLTLAEGADYGVGVFFQSKLSEVTIGANSTFGDASFRECHDLTTVNMPEGGNVHFSRLCFANCTALKNIDLSKIDEVIEEETFYGCSSLRVANIGHVKNIGNYAFGACIVLSNVDLSSVEVLGDGVFSRDLENENGGAPMISKITLPSTLTSIGIGTFVGCADLQEVDIQAELSEIPDWTFAFCLNVEKITIPQTVKRIGKYAFVQNEKLTVIDLSHVEIFDENSFSQSTLLDADISSAKQINYYAFGATSLSGVIDVENLISVGDYAFQNTFIEKFNAPNLEKIGEAAFYGNAQMTEFKFSSKLAFVGPMAFVDCFKLETFKFDSNGEEKTEGEINGYAKIQGGALYTKMDGGDWLLSSIPAALNVETFEVANGTARIEFYAGNENKNVKHLILPDGLKLIGNYAFYGYDKLESVEFRSLEAPALEDGYNGSLTLADTAPGFDKLHPFFDLFGLELYYCNFIDFLGNKEPIKMTVPKNEDIFGYDSLVYEVYFGNIENATVSEYVAMEKNLSLFIEYAAKISKLENVTLSHESLINKAMNAYKAITQDATAYGISEEEWNEAVESVQSAKKTLTAIKIQKASKAVRDVQSSIDSLDKTFSVQNIPTLKAVASQINSLTVKDKAILDLTAYNELMAEYNAYLEALEIEIEPTVNALSNLTFSRVATVMASSLAIGGLLTVLLIALKRKFL